MRGHVLGRILERVQLSLGSATLCLAFSSKVAILVCWRSGSSPAQYYLIQ